MSVQPLTQKRRKTLHRGAILLAATCPKCGRFCQAADFKLRGGVPETSRCRQCNYRLSTKKPPEKHRSDVQRSRQTRQAPTIASAGRHMRQWTGAELEIVSRDDLTLEQLAAMLGRTYNAVRGARDRVRRDPKYAALAGNPR